MSEASDPAPGYAVTQADGVSHLVARGDHPRVTQALVETVRLLPRALGVVLVDAKAGREWVADPISRADALEAVLTLRDLLGRGLLDLAVYGARESLEIFLDRFGTLEIRSAAWRENALAALLEEKGFGRLPSLSAVPALDGADAFWTDESAQRFHGVCESLGMQPPRE